MENKKLILQELDKYFAILGLILSIVYIFSISLFSTNILYLLVGILSFFSFLIYLRIRKKFIKKENPLQFECLSSKFKTQLLVLIFFTLFSLSIISMYIRPFQYERPLLYFCLNSMMAGIIVLEILFFKKKLNILILTQIIILGLSSAYSQLLIFPNVVGADPWYHQMFTNTIINDAIIPAQGSYADLPIFHLIIGSNSLISDLSYKFSAMSTVSFSQIVINVFFIFLLAKLLFKNHRIGLLSALFIVIANRHIWTSYWSIPNSIAPVFGIIILYLLLKFETKNREKIFLLCILLMFTLIVTHSISAMWFMIMLFIGWLSYEFYKYIRSCDYKPIGLRLPILFFVLLFSWWTYVSGHILSLFRFIEGGFSEELIIDQNIRIITSLTPILNQFFSVIGMMLFFSISLIGILYMISIKGNKNTFSMATMGFITLGISFLPLLTGHSLVQERWEYFAQILLCIPLAVSFFLIFNNIRLDRKKIEQFMIFGFMVILTFLLAISPPANSDNFTLTSGNRASLTESEISAVETISSISNDRMISDAWYSLLRYEGYQIGETQNLGFSENYTAVKGLILMRDEVSNSQSLLLSMGFNKTNNPNKVLDNQGFSKIYTSYSVNGYRKNR